MELKALFIFECSHAMLISEFSEVYEYKDNKRKQPKRSCYC